MTRGTAHTALSPRSGLSPQAVGETEARARSWTGHGPALAAVGPQDRLSTSEESDENPGS